MKKKERKSHRSHMRQLGFIILAIAAMAYLANTGLTFSELATWPGEGGSITAAANNYTLRSLLILALFIVGVLLIVFGK
jgi:predicted nucleic acid-binding Zn ribbon protein